MSEQLNAAEWPRMPRLRQTFDVFDDSGSVLCRCDTEESAAEITGILNENSREHCTGLVDEAFARSVASRVSQGGRYFTGPDVEGSFSIRLVGNDVIFRIDRFNAATFTNPTIGDFYTAARLFKVQLKEKD